MESSTTKVGIKVEYLNGLKVMDLANDPQVMANFIQLYVNTHPGATQADAEIFHARESLFFNKLLLASEDLRACTKYSLYSCLTDVVTNGGTFDPTMDLMYIEIRHYNVGTQTNKVWEHRASNTFTAQGELNVRMQLGQILYVDTPRIVYEHELFDVIEEKGKVNIIYHSKIPRTSKRIIASFMKITRPDGSWDYSYLTEEDITRFRISSEKNNKSTGKANALYTSCNGGIDPGFLATKTIRHGFRVFPKARIVGSNTNFQDDGERDETTMIHDAGKVDTTEPVVQIASPLIAQQQPVVQNAPQNNVWNQVPLDNEQQQDPGPVMTPPPFMQQPSQQQQPKPVMNNQQGYAGMTLFDNNF